MLQSILQLCQRELLILEHVLLDAVQGVARIDDTNALRSGEVPDRAALLDGLALLDAALDQAGLERQRHAVAVCGIDAVVCLDHVPYEELHLLLECIDEVLDAGEIGDLARLRTDLIAECTAVVQRDIHDLCHVERACVMPAVVLVRDIRLHAAGRVVCTGNLQRDTAVDHRRDDDFIVEQVRHTIAQTDNLDVTIQELIRRLRTDTGTDGRHGHTHMSQCIQAHIAHLIGQVVAFLIGAAQCDQLEHLIAGERLCGNVVTHLILIIELDEQAVQQLLGKVLGDRLVVDVIGVHVTVERTGRIAVCVRLQVDQVMNEPEGLQCFPPGLCGMLRHLVAVLGDLQQFCTAGGVVFLRCHVLCQLTITMCIVNCSGIADQQSLIELQLLDRFRLLIIHLSHCFQDFLNNTLETNLQDLLIVAAHMADTGIHVVACIEHCVGLASLALRAHQGPCIVAHRVVLPVIIQMADNFLVLLADVELVAGTGLHGIQLVDQIRVGILHADIRRTGMYAGGTDDQFLITDDDRQVVEQVFIHLCAAHNGRHALGCLVRLRHQACTVRLHHRPCVHDHLLQTLNTVCRLGKAFFNHGFIHYFICPPHINFP